MFLILLGVPIAVDKLVLPTTHITFLGIEIDSVDHYIRLPSDKLMELKTLLAYWIDKKKSSKCELLSLIGKLSFAAKVVKPGAHLSATVDRSQQNSLQTSFFHRHKSSG